jgi:DnaJ-class molecular chaperone
MSTDLYSILGIDKTANSEDIRRAYKQLALKLHPDKNPENPEAFKEVSRAYAILSDPDKKQLYDATGCVDDMTNGMGSGMPDFQDLFASMFSQMGNMHPGGHPFRQQAPMSHDSITLTVSLTDVFHGTSKHVEFEALDMCKHCSGSRAASPSDVISCLTCNGQGQIRHTPLPFVVAMITCNSCGGRGKTIQRPCPACTGSGTCYSRRAFEIKVPKGIADGHAHLLKGKGGFDIDRGCYRDLILHCKYDITESQITIDHKTKDVHMILDVPIEDLLCGFTKDIELYGKKLVLHAPHFFNPDNSLTIADWGLPIDQAGSKNGTLHVTFNVKYPTDDRFIKYRSVLCKMFKREEAEVNVPQSTSDQTVVLVNI